MKGKVEEERILHERTNKEMANVMKEGAQRREELKNRVKR
jgi:hypothetical protein